MEDMLYEVESVRRFVGLRLPGPLPDETTILNFRHLLEEHELGAGLFEEINRYLESKGLRLQEGTIVDAGALIGEEWAGCITSCPSEWCTAPRHERAWTSCPGCSGGESQVWGDAGYQGVDKRPGNRGLDVEWQVAMRPGQRRKLEPGSPEAGRS